jgi:hypothetical protein
MASGQNNTEANENKNKQNLDSNLSQLMQKCWPEEFGDRPDFQSLKQIIRKMNK